MIRSEVTRSVGDDDVTAEPEITETILSVEAEYLQANQLNWPVQSDSQKSSGRSQLLRKKERVLPLFGFQIGEEETAKEREMKMEGGGAGEEGMIERVEDSKGLQQQSKALDGALQPCRRSSARFHPRSRNRHIIRNLLNHFSVSRVKSRPRRGRSRAKPDPAAFQVSDVHREDLAQCVVRGLVMGGGVGDLVEFFYDGKGVFGGEGGPRM
ncbi:hypothetical protein Vadar_012618 [Vaccinium darrowii]|uniref:Uncharacterized protein n=1 Tax=Vaccinium darrowii TaxID=229202 RepID=A0ACB7YVA9_9ERIC|nr:hypothetical protein Vadar_012618 [Vaccinium darrowii]